MIFSLKLLFSNGLMSSTRYRHLRKMIHFLDPLDYNNNNLLKKLQFTIARLAEVFIENYTRNRNAAVDEEYLSLWKESLSFRIYIPRKRESFKVKLFMLCEIESRYLSQFIIYTTAQTDQGNDDVLLKPWDEYKSPSKVILSLTKTFLNQGYIRSFDNYYMSVELAKALLH